MERIAELNKALNDKLAPAAKVMLVLVIVVLTGIVVLTVFATMFNLFLSFLGSGFVSFVGGTVLMMGFIAGVVWFVKWCASAK